MAVLSEFITIWTMGILTIIISIYILNLIISKYLKEEKFKNYLYLTIMFIAIYLVFGIYIMIYANNLVNNGIDENILIEKVLFLRLLLQIPLAIGFTILLITCYGSLAELKYKLIK